MLEQEINEIADKWIAELWQDMDRQLDRARKGEPFDTDLYRQRANVESLLMALQGVCQANIHAEVHSAVEEVRQ